MEMPKMSSQEKKEITILAKDNNFSLQARTRYIQDIENNKRIWAVIHYKHTNKKVFCVWLGYVDRETDFKQFLKDFYSKFWLVDKRNLGFYCVYCKKFSPEFKMGWGEGIFIDNECDKRRMLVNEHYDGCRGWE